MSKYFRLCSCWVLRRQALLLELLIIAQSASLSQIGWSLDSSRQAEEWIIKVILERLVLHFTSHFRVVLRWKADWYNLGIFFTSSFCAYSSIVHLTFSSHRPKYVTDLRLVCFAIGNMSNAKGYTFLIH